jgi:membrane protease YdiL (CAAX protease family)
LAYGLTWLCWIPVALSGQEGTASPWIIPYMLGGFGPMAAGFIMAFRLKGREGLRDLWMRMIDFRHISWGWYAFIFLIFPILFAAGVLLAVFLNAPLPGFQALRAVIANPLSLVGLLIIGIIAGALSEEPGWRGFALDQLQVRWSPLMSSLLLGFLWGGWHMPLFFMRGTTQYAWGFATPRFWLFLVGAFSLSLL